MEITPNTKLLGIFGFPIGHTLSPVMQNAAIKASGLDMVFLAFHVPPSRLKDAVKAVRALDMLGVNVTIPHKEAIIEFLDELDPEAEKIGAVNTVVNRDGRLTGYNTDGRGYLRSLVADTGFSGTSKRVLMLGAGGAARGILYAILGQGPASVVIANRNEARAEGLIQEFSGAFPNVELRATGLKQASSFYADTDLLVNTTSMGMSGAGPPDPSVLSLKALAKDAVVSDIVYKPLETELLKAAEARGLRTHKGLGMLVGQGELAFELWTGKAAPQGVMMGAALGGIEEADAR